MDRLYKPTKILRAYRFRAARAAVLGVLVPRERLWFDNVPKAMDKLRAQWRIVISRLHHAGWSPVRDLRSLQIFRNCPPFGVHTAVKSWSCRRALICPFCYARQHVIEPFDRLTYALTQAEETWAPSCHLVEFSTTNWAKFQNNRSFVDCFRWAMEIAESPARRIEAFTLHDTYGGFVLQRFDFNDDTLYLRRSGVFLIPPDCALLRDARGRRVRVHENVNKKLLAAVLGRVCRYPPGLWRSDDPKKTCFVLNSLRTKRLLSYFGVLRHVSKSAL